MRVALYCRASTTAKGQDTEIQARELCEYTARGGWKVVQEFADRGISGAKESRPALDEMLKVAKRRRFNAVLCWKLDRIGRSLSR
jgi:DNA invertase Pin-like site-specific DNA recombinase